MMDRNIKRFLNLKTRNIFFVFLALFLFEIQAQTEQSNLFDDYWKIGLSVNRDLRFVENEENSIDFRIENIKSMDLGIVWNYYQWQHHNLKLELRYSMFPYKVKTSFNIKEQDAYLGFAKYLIGKTVYNEIKIAPTYEYFIPIKDKFLVLGVGPKVSHMLTKGKIFSGRTEITTNIPGQQEVIGQAYEGKINNEFLYGIIGNVGFIVPTKIGAFNLNVHGHLGFNKFFETEVNTFNLIVSPDTSSSHDMNNHYIGLGLNYYPKRKSQKIKD